MEQVDDNLKTFTGFKTLSEAEKNTIDKVVEVLNSRVQNGCTGCRYCMPCPAGVDIPGCFSAWNTYHMYQNYYAVNWKWEQEMGEAHQAKNCIKCGKCKAICPYDAISVEENLAVIDPKKCNNCGLCAIICPQKLIASPVSNSPEIQQIVKDSLKNSK